MENQLGKTPGLSMACTTLPVLPRRRVLLYLAKTSSSSSLSTRFGPLTLNRDARRPSKLGTWLLIYSAPSCFM